MFRIRHPENDLDGREHRDAVDVLDLDACLREAMGRHMRTVQRSRRDVALSLRMSEQAFLDWFEGRSPGSLELFSLICGLTKMTPSEVLSYSPTYRKHATDVVDYSVMVAKRLAQSMSPADMHQRLAIQHMLEVHPEAEVAIWNGIETAIAYAERMGFDVSRVAASLERTAEQIKRASQAS